jgi:hypothetical protein
VLFLLRPRQTWMPYAVPRSREQQALHNQQLHEAYLSTRRVATPTPTPPVRPDMLAQLKELAQLHEAGSLTATEFSTAKSKILDREDEGS